jgi:hypothetical protein
VPSAKHIQGLSADGRRATHPVSAGRSTRSSSGHGATPSGAGRTGAGSRTGSRPGGADASSATRTSSADLPLQAPAGSGGDGSGGAGRVGGSGTGRGAPRVRGGAASPTAAASTVPYVPATAGVLAFDLTAIVANYFTGLG